MITNKKIMIDSSANELNLSRETADQRFERKEESLKHMREYLKENLSIFSSEHFKSKFGAKIYPYDQSKI